MSSSAMYPIHYFHIMDSTYFSCYHRFFNVNEPVIPRQQFGYSASFFAKCNSFLLTVSPSLKTDWPQKRKPVLTWSTWGRSLQTCCLQAWCVSCWWCLSTSWVRFIILFVSTELLLIFFLYNFRGKETKQWPKIWLQICRKNVLNLKGFFPF